jgi:hypothetical protein
MDTQNQTDFAFTLNWINQTLKVAKEWETKLMPETLGSPTIPKQLDFFFIRIMGLKDKQEIDRDTIITLVGTLLGQMFVDRFGYNWKTIEDFMGKDLVVENPQNNYQLFPFSIVQQRVDAREVGFVTKLAEMLEKM